MIPEDLGLFYLGKETESHNPVFLKSQDLTTHAVILGMTGSGKTGLGISLLEEAAIDGIPSLIIDPKGDLSNLKLAFPKMQTQDFSPWVEKEASAEAVSKTWKEGILASGQGLDRVLRLNEAVEVEIYTPGSLSGKPLSLLNRLGAPEDIGGEKNDLIASQVSAILALVGVEADPLQSPEHILLSKILDEAWKNGQSVDLPFLIQRIRKPSFSKVGVLDLETFMSEKERLKLALKLNNLIASPGFERWIQGDPLDIQKLLWTREGKPKMAVLSIAHLNDSERMFFITLFLNSLIGWMRNQPGTSSLRALLYMDEIFGYFPPSEKPPSKMPMLTLLKQARAFGLGVVLSTQNPMDLDYKGLSNAGTWFIGHLQTENDKKRLLEGLPELGKEELDKGFQKREFLLKLPGGKKLIKFITRWTLSYLKGPLTLKQIESFYPQKTLSKTISEPKAQEKYHPPDNLKELFSLNALNRPLKAHLLTLSKMHWVDKRLGVDTWKNVAFIVPLRNGPLWDQAEKIAYDLSYWSTTPKEGSEFESITENHLDSRGLKEEKKNLSNWLLRNVALELFSAPKLKLKSTPEESERDFKARLSLRLREEKDKALNKLQKKHETSYRKLQDKMSKQQTRLAREKEQADRQRYDTYISFGSTILGALLGQKSGAVEKAGTAARRARRIGKEDEEVQQAKARLGSIQAEMDQLSEEVAQEADLIKEEYNLDNVKIEKISLSPRKSDINVEALYLLWK